jgi:hypothetical protein
MQLAENILDYYLAHLSELTEEKQFHLCSRLAAWTGNHRAIEQLAKMREHYVPNPCAPEALKEQLQDILDNLEPLPANAAKVRDPYFAKYPWLRGLELVLFRVRHLKEIYGVDARAALFELVPRRQLLEYKQLLLADSEALRILSTYAVNYIFLLERVVLEQDNAESIDLKLFYNLADDYNLDDPVHLQLYIYLYTHCIIADAHFYVMPIPTYAAATYTKMLQRLEPIITERMDELSLDTKLEYLVCCRICDFNTSVTKAIYDECRDSVSPEGTFLVDTVNAFADRTAKKSFDASEHRNVLFVMSSLSYVPHQLSIGQKSV